MAMKRTVVVVAAGLMVLGGSLAFAEGMKPGLWEITSKNKMQGVEMPVMPAIPPEQLAKMKEMGIQIPSSDGGQGITVRHCVTKEEAEKGAPSPPDPDSKTKCVQKDVKKEGNKMSWKMECTGEHPATGTGSMVFEGPEGYSGTSTIITKDPKQGTMTMNSTYSGKWISDSCK